MDSRRSANRKLLREIIEEITTVEMELKELVKAGGEKDTEIEKLNNRSDE